MASGGYRPPASPAPASGPGALARRTDGGPSDKQPVRSLPDPAYGEGQEFRALQQAAPLPEQGGMPAQAAPVPLTEPTQDPEAPLTDGMSFGPGRTSAISSMTNEHVTDMQMVAKYWPQLQAMASRPDTPQGFRRFITYLKAFQQ